MCECNTLILNTLSALNTRRHRSDETHIRKQYQQKRYLFDRQNVYFYIFCTIFFFATQTNNKKEYNGLPTTFIEYRAINKF